MRQAVDRFIKRHDLLKKEAVVVVGVSGGPDSMALMDYLERVKNKWSLTLIAASADHQMRGEASAADVRYVKNYCRKRDLAFEEAKLNVNAFREKHEMGVQEAARACRYRFFADVMNRYDADFLALAHHGDDQVETLLMRRVRGSFGYSRAGIPVRRPFATGEVIRPLLCVDKQQIEAYCRNRGIIPRRDRSNESDDYTRNRFRHHILPFLKSENPSVHVRYQQESEMLFDDEACLAELAKGKLQRVTVSKTAGEAVWSTDVFANISPALQRRMIHLVLNYLYRKIPPSLSTIHIEDVRALAHRNHPSGRLDLPGGLRVVRSYHYLIFTFKREEREGVRYRYRLDVPGKVRVPFGMISAEIGSQYEKYPDDCDTFVCDAGLVHLPLFVRTRSPGDRLSPKGMKGSRKVKAIFIDHKIPMDLRDQWPLVEDENGTILWIPGVKHSGVAQPSGKTEKKMILRFRTSGTFGRELRR
ncbi:MAG TPA: tRNA lysidine(34) synthetase TilS [Bacillales bacterium]|nr:tRNA lysidine(34) synthetase TilS [Bacillales bacterium]